MDQTFNLTIRSLGLVVTGYFFRIIPPLLNCFRDNESRIYNVRANAGDFIIGEAGRIDNSGQTLEVENYS